MNEPADPRYAAIARALDGREGVSISTLRGFGAGGLTVGGKLFAMSRRGELLLKLPAADVARLIASGECAPFDAGKGRPMKAWVLVAPAVPLERWLALAEAAMAYVATVPRAR